MEYAAKSVIKKVYGKRDAWSHKGQHGKLFVIAGSERHTGSAIFVGMAAYRAGCDLVHMVGPRRAMDVAAGHSPLLITQPLEGKHLDSSHVSDILAMMDEVKPTAVAIGPGLWRTDDTRKAIMELVGHMTNMPIVIDADAIRAVSACKHILARKKIIMTPHDNEFLELSGMKVSRTNLKERVKTVADETHRINCLSGVCPFVPPVVTLLKGHIDIITNGKTTALNRSGDPKMTVGGMGDTLTGICGALLARGVDTFPAAEAAAYINGLAGSMAVKKYGESTVTTDLIDEIYNALK